MEREKICDQVGVLDTSEYERSILLSCCGLPELIIGHMSRLRLKEIPSTAKIMYASFDRYIYFADDDVQLEGMSI